MNLLSPSLPASTVAGIDQPTIVVLDDEPAVQELLRLRLERSGYKVLTAGTYDDFIQLMSGGDAVLCDIILPGNDGLQALKWMREHYPHIPVIMMTGEPTYETAAEAIRLEAYDYLAKPINKDELLATVARAVTHHRLALDKDRLEKENEAYRLELEQRVTNRTRELRESQEFLTNLTNTMADAVFNISWPDYRIEYVNKAVIQIFGYQPEELLGQSLPILYPDPTTFETFLQKQKVLFKSGQHQMRLEQLLRHKSDKLIWTEMAVTYVFAKGQPVEMISVVRDISQRSLLLGVVAHELRGPLALLGGFLDVLLEDVENIDRESMIKYLASINTTVGRMFTMLNELLDVTSIELGQISLNFEQVDLNNLLRTHIEAYAYIAHKKNITLRVQPTSQTLLCPCDPTKIGQVISNFIDNAIKYSKPNTQVELKAERRAAMFWVGIQDQGPGVKPAEIEHLFKNFGKTSSRPTGGEKSTGLGLAICKKIIEAHHGEIGVETAPQQRGATFWFSLPQVPPSGRVGTEEQTVKDE